jgi:MFS family permease
MPTDTTPSDLAGALPRPPSTLAIVTARPALMVVMGTVAGHMMMMSMLAPMLSLYGKSFGVAEWAVGLVITAFGVGRLVMDLPAGLIAEKFGRRLLIWAGPAVVGVASLGAALADDFVWLVVFRFVQGLGSGAYMTVASVVVADLAAPHERGRLMALFQTAMLIGAGLGPAVGGFLAEAVGYAAPFWVSMIIGFSAALYAFFGFPETRVSGHGGRHDHSVRAFAPLVANPAIAVALFLNFAVFTTRAASQWQMLPFVAHDRFGYDTGMIGLTIMTVTLANLAVLPWAGRLIDRFGTVACTVATAAITTAALVLAALSSEPWMYWLAMALIGAATGVQGPAVATYAVDHTPAGCFGPTMGLMRFAGDIGFVVSPLALGAVIDLAGVSPGGAVLINAGLMAAGAAAFLVWGRREPEPDHPPASVAEPPVDPIT